MISLRVPPSLWLGELLDPPNSHPLRTCKLNGKLIRNTFFNLARNFPDGLDGPIATSTYKKQKEPLLMREIYAYLNQINFITVG
jgi:hypothetical protein